MFERFTRSARAVVTGAGEHAERAGADTVDAGHLLLALLDLQGSRGSFALAALGADRRREEIAEALADARRRGGLTQADTEALAGLGVDVDEIVARVEETHGAGVLAGAGTGRGRKGIGSWFGHRPFGREAKDTLVRALRIATERRQRTIGDEHILLALTTRPGIVAEVLGDRGVTREALDRVLT
ncbi:Clp protease N-terminal domain-containing protein [Streptomyces sp. AN091965]|uniref:Clp protease N-terminal domain-containing protein n=1 Tax=Streptomyces sp. AN091965 TaxID=2927803 RepID=UPI001F60ED10|nr:Clp protease N-terminal domain-containing protein [Streptomyces sp. AN091965]MCI3933018.1 Clp protease N-terminal domain-containing protein [Streptomyces sp. AN091965]